MEEARRVVVMWAKIHDVLQYKIIKTGQSSPCSPRHNHPFTQHSVACHTIAIETMIHQPHTHCSYLFSPCHDLHSQRDYAVIYQLTWLLKVTTYHCYVGTANFPAVFLSQASKQSKTQSSSLGMWRWRPLFGTIAADLAVDNRYINAILMHAFDTVFWILTAALYWWDNGEFARCCYWPNV